MNIEGKQLLLVEDSEMYRELLKAQLSLADMHVTAVENGKEALAALEAGSYDIVLMDREMPVLNGLEAARAIRERLGLHDLPIICLSGDASEASREEVMQAGADELLGKPVPEDVLIDTLQAWLNNGKQREANESPPASNVAEENRLRDNAAQVALQQSETADVLDSQHIAASTQQNDALFLRQVQRFLRLWSGFENQLQQAASDEDPGVMLRLVHNLNSNAALIGANNLSDSAAALERQIRQGQTISDLDFSLLSSKLSAVINVLRERYQLDQEHWYGDADDHAQVMQASDPELLETLSRLRDLIRGHEADALKEIQQLSDAVLEPGIHQRLKRVAYHLQDFDFGAAERMIDQLLPQRR